MDGCGGGKLIHLFPESPHSRVSRGPHTFFSAHCNQLPSLSGVQGFKDLSVLSIFLDTLMDEFTL